MLKFLVLLLCLGTARFLEVEPGVKLEVLDFGGNGEPLVMLTGLGDTAHSFCHFAHQFTDRFHVYAITRRGFGKSSQPATGYDVATRARDDVRVLDGLGVGRAVFLGHSMAGDELSELGSAYPDRVSKLVYLDALDYGSHSKLPQPPMPEFSDRDTSSLELFSAANARFFGTRLPEEAMREVYRFGPSGEVLGVTSRADAGALMAKGSKQARYADIKAPVLAILAPLAPRQPFYPYLTPAQQAEYDRVFPPLLAWQEDAIARLKTIPRVEVILLPGAYHYLYLTQEAFVVEAIRAFLGYSKP